MANRVNASFALCQTKEFTKVSLFSLLKKSLQVNFLGLFKYNIYSYVGFVTNAKKNYPLNWRRYVKHRELTSSVFSFETATKSIHKKTH